MVDGWGMGIGGVVAGGRVVTRSTLSSGLDVTSIPETTIYRMFYIIKVFFSLFSSCPSRSYPRKKQTFLGSLHGTLNLNGSRRYLTRINCLVHDTNIFISSKKLALLQLFKNKSNHSKRVYQRSVRILVPLKNSLSSIS